MRQTTPGNSTSKLKNFTFIIVQRHCDHACMLTRHITLNSR